jgi:hypothetical protein
MPPLRPPLAPKPKARRRRREPIPEPIRRAVIEFARALEQNHAANFTANPGFKRRVGQFLAAELPPRRRPGRPGIPEVSRAEHLFTELRRLHPDEPEDVLWQSIYCQIFPGYDSLNAPDRRAAEELRNRVRWRRRARRRTQMRKMKT